MPRPDSGRPDERMRRRNIARLVIGAIVLIYAIVFVVLNRGRVKIHFLFFTVTTRLWVGLLVSVALGALLFYGFGAYRRHSGRSESSGGGTAAA